MSRIITVFVLFITHQLYSQVPQTVFELSEGKETATYSEIISFYQQLDSLHEEASLIEMGLTDSGEKLHLFLITKDGFRSPSQTLNQNKVTILINNGIHPGEPDGIEASMMFARDLLDNPDKVVELDSISIGIIPVYNIGGALNRNSTTRVNQNGPVEYGFRGNARNFDLNRDFIKADTRNTLSFQQIYQSVDPDIFIDTHVSNGADYQYTITHVTTQHNKLGGMIGSFMHGTFLPELEQEMVTKNWKMTPYVNVFNRPPDAEGFSQFLDAPRYSSGYAALFHSIGFMVETHMLKPFADRVNATYEFLQTTRGLARKHGPYIQGYRNQSRGLTPGEYHIIDWKLNPGKSRKIDFDGYEATYVKSEVSGLDRLKYDRSRPYTKSIDYFDTYIPAKQVQIPKAYIIPSNWFNIIEKLQANGVPMRPFRNDSLVTVEAYLINTYETYNRPYEGHYPHYNVDVSTVIREKLIRKGDFIVEVKGPTARFVVEVLEPEATDSYFKWNFFDTILQQKEGFSPYVFEDLAAEMLIEDENLRSTLEMSQQYDSAFASSGYRQLQMIYERSKYKEDAYMLYPIFRVMN